MRDPRELVDQAKKGADKMLDGEDRAILSEVRLIGAGLVLILVMTLVLDEVYNAIDVSGGPFDGVVTSLENTGTAAMTLLVVGLLVVAASAIMRFFNTGFGSR